MKCVVLFKRLGQLKLRVVSDDRIIVKGRQPNYIWGGMVGEVKTEMLACSLIL